MTGDWEGLSSAFNITRKAEGKGWRLKLEPMRADDPSMPIRVMDLHGFTLLGRRRCGQAEWRPRPHRVPQSEAGTGISDAGGSRTARQGRPALTRMLALVWLAVVVLAVGYLIVRNPRRPAIAYRSLGVAAPRGSGSSVAEGQRRRLQRARASGGWVLVGHPSRQEALAAAIRLTEDITATGLMESGGRWI